MLREILILKIFISKMLELVFEMLVLRILTLRLLISKKLVLEFRLVLELFVFGILNNQECFYYRCLY